jgi:hypothetical protein
MTGTLIGLFKKQPTINHAFQCHTLGTMEGGGGVAYHSTSFANKDKERGLPPTLLNQYGKEKDIDVPKTSQNHLKPRFPVSQIDHVSQNWTLGR